MKKKIIVAGSSHTFGLSLELQHAERFNNVEFLKKYGINLPIDHTEEDEQIWNKYRWSRLLADALNLEEVNINSSTCDPFWKAGTCGNTLLKFLHLTTTETQDIEVVILQPTLERFEYFSESDNQLKQLTPREMINILEECTYETDLIKKIQSFIETFDIEEKLLEFSVLFRAAVERHPHINFYIILWYDSIHEIESYKKYDFFQNYIEPHLLKFYNRRKVFRSPSELLKEYKMLITDRAFCYVNQYDEYGTMQWEINEPDYHGSSEGNIEIYLQILKQIKWEVTDGNV